MNLKASRPAVPHLATMPWYRRLTSQLAVLMVLLTIVATASIGAIAYAQAQAQIEQDALRAVGITADARKQALLMRLRRRYDTALNLLGTLDRAGPVSSERPRALLWETIRPIGGLACRVESVGGPPFELGDRTKLPALPDAAPRPGQIAWCVRQGQPPGGFWVVRVNDSRHTLTISFPLSEISQIFEQPYGLGRSGETFLVDSTGRFLTPSRYWCNAGNTMPITARPMQRALSGHDEEVVDRDYRDVMVIHGFRFLPEIGGAVLMAHIDRTEAFAPLGRLRARILLSGALIALAALLASLGLSWWIARPMRRLSARAVAMQQGDFTSVIPVEGPAEVQSFARTFADLAHALKRSRAELMLVNSQLELRVEERSQELESRTRQMMVLEQSDRFKDQLLAIISHELRTPLNAVMGFGNILSDELAGPLSIAQHGYLENMLDASEVLLKLIDDLLDMSYIRAGKCVLTPEVVDLGEVAACVTHSLEGAARRKDLSLLVECPPDLPALWVDGHRLQQVLMNLVDNAIKFSPVGGAITIAASVRGAWLRLEIRDRGPGIAPLHLPLLFERFSQGDMSSTRTVGGVGLGLAISKALVEAHGGTIGVESAPGSGSTFWFTMPLWDGANLPSR